MVSREPRQIVKLEVVVDKSSERIQKIVDSGSIAEKYCTDDGYLGYIDIANYVEYIRNINKKIYSVPFSVIDFL